MTDITLYNYNGDFRTVNKKITGGQTVAGLLHVPTSVLSPVISMRASEWNKAFNYLYIGAYKRYYTIDRATLESSDKITLYCTVDVLKTYEAQIMEAGATVTSSDNGQPYISVRNDVYNVKPNFEKLEFPNKGLLNKDGNIIMITIKGK